jgi:uncharacterized membrane protein YhaH (DUF805 family)
MAFSNLWHGRTGRLPYLVALVISSAAIAVLPFVAGKITVAFVAGGADPALAIVRMLLRPLLLGIGLLITGGPLVFFARRRMRELGLSGVWLLVFPIGPLWMLLLFAVVDTSLIIWPLPVTSPVMTLPFWVEFAFGASLAVLPSGDYLEHSASRILRLAHLATTCEGRLSRQTFALHLAIAFGLTIVLDVFGTWGAIRNFARPGEHSVSILASVVTSASALLSVFVTMFLTSSTIKRLHDLNQKGWWIILFPFGLTSLMSFLALISLAATPQLIVATLFSPFTIFSSVQGLGCLIVLVWLLLKRGSDLDNPHGRPVIPPDRSYLPA